MKALSTVKEGFQFRLGNGNSSFWFSNWSGSGMLANQVLFVDIHDLEMRVRDVYVDGNWHFNSLYTNLPLEIKEKLSSTTISLNPSVNDCYTWNGNLNGTYISLSLSTLSVLSLSLGYGTYRRRCNIQAETTLHCLRDCDFVQAIWKSLDFDSDVCEMECSGGTGMILNVDVSSIGNPGVSGFGGLIRNADGAWVHGFFGNLGVTNILHAELMAIYKGLLLAWDLNVKDLWCYSDSKMAIKLITKPVDELHHYAAILNNIKELLNRDWRVLILHTFREGNAYADYLAKHGANNTYVFVSIAIPPVLLNFSLLADASGT
ncbi:hypothetical protein TSUD_384370 [Trifolium subterraneum]|uniref:RNase H type-1 domain-containing protein n=1 Tax=Trifolium subterraneum TaxID=3900 RepID=A0A2Z6NFR1_TRISU|nr:hypothetical protein TSUD_384370 [Trifolium subterraneum]